MTDILETMRLAESGGINIGGKALRQAVAEIEHIRRQRDELQACNTRLVEERRSYDRTAQVREFFAVVAPDQERHFRPTVPSDEMVRFRLRLIAEEFVELLDACLGKPSSCDFDAWSCWNEITSSHLTEYIEKAPLVVNLPELADALGDIDYVVEGMRVAFGIDGRPIAKAIHESNLKKADGPVVDGKKQKPPGWTPPDVAGELVKQGWSGAERPT